MWSTLKMRTRSPLKARVCSPLQARMSSPLMARTYSPLKVIGTSTQGSTFMRKQEIDSSRGPVIPNPQDLDIRCRKSMQLTWFLGMQMHATFVVKFGKCGLHMKQCNVMESCTMFMTFFPYFVILILIWFFWKTQIDCPFERGDSPCNLILSFANLSKNSLWVLFCLIYSFDHFGVTAMESFDV